THDDKRIRVIRQDRVGLAAALNKGFNEARSALIARLDADDCAVPNRLERQGGDLERHPQVGLLGCWAVEIDENWRQLRNLTPESDPDRLARIILRTNPFIHSSVMLRREVFDRVGPFRTAFLAAEDYDMWLRASEVTQVANLGEYLVQYRRHDANVSNQ